MIELCNGCESCLYGVEAMIISQPGEPLKYVCEAPNGIYRTCGKTHLILHYRMKGWCPR